MDIGSGAGVVQPRPRGDESIASSCQTGVNSSTLAADKIDMYSLMQGIGDKRTVNGVGFHEQSTSRIGI
jgi:hypothetical protein